MGNIIRWSIRVIYILVPLAGCVLKLIVDGFIRPMFFGGGVDEVILFFSKPTALIALVQVVILFAVNMFYTPFLNAICSTYRLLVGSAVSLIDLFYDKLLGGTYGKGQSTIVTMVQMILQLFCFGLGTFCISVIMFYLCYDGLANMSLSWNAWIEMRFAEQITYRWGPMLAAVLFLTEPMLHIIDRPVRGVIEIALHCVRDDGSKQNANSQCKAKSDVGK